MTKLSPTLKWLVEKRARVAGELQQRECVLQELQVELAKLRDDLQALDRSLAVYDTTIDVTAIEPVNAQSRYGARGALQNFLLQVLEARAPAAARTDELASLAAVHFNLDFETSGEPYRWQRNSLRNTLKNLCKERRTPE